MDVSGQLHAPAALPPREEFSVPIGHGAFLDAVAKRKSPNP
jgi:hypothetical protein